jgi:hypothetical protein
MILNAVQRFFTMAVLTVSDEKRIIRIAVKLTWIITVA